MTKRSLDLLSEYILLDPKGKSSVWKSDDFWAMAFDKSRKENNRDMGCLVSSYEFNEDWKSWEKHPHGDEVVIALSGHLEFILVEGDATTQISLQAGQACIVPKDTWHTAKVKSKARALFITFGYGTAHKAI